MCTLTWWKPTADSSSYHLFFNRDELNTRPQEVAPHGYSHRRTTAIYPLDPQGKGTWIGVNENGRSVALLNDYQGTISPEAQTSRGLLVRDLLYSKNCSMLLSEVSQYRPFHLCIFERKEISSYYHWNGLELNSYQIDSEKPFFLSSSSYQPDQVIPERTAVWQLINRDANDYLDQIRNFHTCPNEILSASTPYMKRDDAHTRSHIEIKVTTTNSEMSYTQSCPQENSWKKTTRYFLARK